ncbi:hypothetical protein ERJ75_001185000 [Trypanosoma vivax]|nr:hypothetical protein ERJ75_001185000 [Trypanosoma vivax]
MAPREGGTNWPPGWETQAERTSIGTRVKDWLKKNSGAKDGAKGVEHTTNPPRRGEKAQVGAWLSGDSRTKVSEGQQRRLGVTQGRKYCGASHATLDTAREEQQRSQLQRARRERVVARRQSEACGGGGQSNDGSARPRKGQKKGARRVVMSKAADEQGAKVTQQWRLNGKGAQGDALPCDRWRSEDERKRHTEAVSGPSRERPCEYASARGRACNHVQQPADSIERHAWSSPRDAAARQSHCGQENGREHRLPSRSKGEALASCEEHLDKRGGVQERKTLFRQRIGEEGGQQRGGWRNSATMTNEPRWQCPGTEQCATGKSRSWIWGNERGAK